MATDNISIKNHQKTNIIVVTENDEAFQKIISLVEKSNNCDELTNVTKRVISQSNEDRTPVTRKRRKADLTCVICNDTCSGYNFNVISCESCKSFFYRNASQNLNDLKCLTDTNHCDIKFNNRHKMCRHCRLEKCLSVGMKSTTDERLNKQRHMEENRRLTKDSIQIHPQASEVNVSLGENNQLTDEFTTTSASTKKSTTKQFHATRLPCSQQHFLTFHDFNLMNSITRSYERAFRFSTVKCDTSDINHIIDRRSGLLYSVSFFYELFTKIIAFIRSIPEFELLNEQDRFIIVKYNFPLVLAMYFCLHYNIQKDLIIVSEAESEEHALVYQQLSCFCYGNQLDSLSNELFRSIKKIINDDPIILQLMLIILTFTKSVSAEDIVMNEQPILVSNKQVYEAQSIYANLLFRYMIEKYSTYHQAALRYSQLIQKIFQMQILVRTYHEFLHEQLVDTADDEINPIIKSILRIS